MSVYSGHAITAESGDVILLKFIESMRIRDDEDMVIDKLKGDVTLSIRTISGKDYTISMNMIRKMLSSHMGNYELAIAICDKWNWIHKP